MPKGASTPSHVSTSSATCVLQTLPTDLTDETMKVPDETQPVPDETRPVVPIFKAHWPDYGTKTTEEGGTCTSDACNSLVAAGPLAGAYILKKHEMDGDASLPGTMWDSKTLQEFRDDPAKMAQNMTYGKPSTDDLQYMMSRNNEVKTALKLWFSVDSIEVLTVNTSKLRKAGKNTHTFVSALSITLLLHSLVCCSILSGSIPNQ